MVFRQPHPFPAANPRSVFTMLNETRSPAAIVRRYENGTVTTVDEGAAVLGGNGVLLDSGCGNVTVDSRTAAVKWLPSNRTTGTTTTTETV